MIVHNFDPVLIDLGLFQIRWYSVAYILGIIIGWMYATKIIKLTTTNQYNFEQIKKSSFDDLIIYLIKLFRVIMKWVLHLNLLP